MQLRPDRVGQGDGRGEKEMRLRHWAAYNFVAQGDGKGSFCPFNQIYITHIYYHFYYSILTFVKTIF